MEALIPQFSQITGLVIRTQVERNGNVFSSFYYSSVSFSACLLSVRYNLDRAGIEGPCGHWEGRIFLFCGRKDGWPGNLYEYTK